MSVVLQGPKLNYPNIDKHSYVVYKVVNQFQPYLLKNQCIIPHPAVRSLFIQKELGEKRANSVT